MKEAAHIITGVHHPPLKKYTKKRYECTKKNGNQSGLNEKQHLNIPNALFLSPSHPVSLALSQGVIILNGAPCYAISAVKHQRK